MYFACIMYFVCACLFQSIKQLVLPNPSLCEFTWASLQNFSDLSISLNCCAVPVVLTATNDAPSSTCSNSGSNYLVLLRTVVRIFYPLFRLMELIWVRVMKRTGFLYVKVNI